MTRRSHTTTQRGAALIMALLAVALATTLAASTLWRHDVWLRQIESQRDLAQARIITTAGIDWARAVLAFDARTSSFDYTGEAWATKVPPTKVEDGEIAGGITDESSKWNLNNVWRDGHVSLPDMQVFQRLLTGLQLSPGLAYALVDWIDPDSEVTPGGAEDSYYLGLTPPYRSPGQLLTEVDDLLRVRGFDPDAVERLRPYVTALPRYNPVNLNTASATVLSAMLPQLSLSEIRQLVDQRDRIPLRNVADLNMYVRTAQGRIDTSGLDTRSQYFSVRVHARYHRAGTVTEALLERQPNDWPLIIWQKFE